MATKSRQTIRWCRVCGRNVRVTLRVHPRSGRRDTFCHRCNHTANTEPRHKEPSNAKSI